MKIPTMAQIMRRMRTPVRLSMTRKEIVKLCVESKLDTTMDKYGVHPSFSSEGGLALSYAKMGNMMKGGPTTGFGEWLHLRFEEFEEGKLQMWYHPNLYRGRTMIGPPELRRLAEKRYKPYTAKEKREIRRLLWDAMNRLEDCANELWGKSE